MLASLIASLLALAPPTSPASAEPPALADEYGAEQAAADVEVVLVDRGKGYLDARARLEDHPAEAAPAVIARLEAVPAPGPEQRDRLLFVLASLEQPEHAALFGEQLRSALIGKRATDIWVQLLRRQGEAATDVLIGLVGDRELDNAARGELLELLVELAPRARLDELMAMVGRGSTELQDHLRRAVIRRAKQSEDDALAIAGGIDEDLEGDPGEADRHARLLILRAACCSVDEGFQGRLKQLAGDEQAAFEVRVAAIDGLGRLALGEGVLAELVAREITAALAGEQAAELLVALALEALPEARGRELGKSIDLLAADAPRLASLGYRLAPLASDHAWLATSQDHAWPEVRKAALERVEGACDKPTTRKLGEIAGPSSKGGDEDARVGRAAVVALGRCSEHDTGVFNLLGKLLDDGGVEASRRAEAARQLVMRDPKGPDRVAAALIDGAHTELGRELASALANTPEPSDAVADALCRAAQGNPMIASTAHQSFQSLFPGESCEE
ncbi:hypothetical protein ACNOYE_18305 [Nannocystaceae bacterium ST9]